MTFDQLCDTVRECTHINDHTGARLEIARYTSQSYYLGLYEAIDKIASLEGRLPYRVGQYRNELDQEFKKFIFDTFTPEGANKLWSCL